MNRSHYRSFGVYTSVTAFLLAILVCLCCQLSQADSQSQQINSLVLVPTEDSTEDDDGKVDPEEPASYELFYPTEEWQTIKPGQAIPRGLHVRVNLETGEKEAKLMELEKPRDPTDVRKNFNAWSHGDRHGMMNPEKKAFTVEELKWALKEMKEDINDKPEETEGPKQPSEGLRTYAELKKDFETMNAGMKTDLEIIRDLINEYRQPGCTDSRKLDILNDFEYYVHQIDNAQNFVDMGGLELAREALNKTDVNFRISAAFLVGSAAQSNPKVQIGAIERGILHNIVRQLPKEKSEMATRRLLYALSALLRHFPYAQKKFIELGGSEIFAQILGLEASEYTLKQKLKIVALITDLLAEQEAAEMESNQETVVGIVNTVSHDRLRQYREIPLRDELRLKGCCGLVARMLPMTSEYDSQEKVLNALHLMTPHCGKEFPSGVRDSVYHLKSIYEAELKKNDPDLVEYLRHLLKIVNDLIEQLPNISHHDERKAEL